MVVPEDATPSPDDLRDSGKQILMGIPVNLPEIPGGPPMEYTPAEGAEVMNCDCCRADMWIGPTQQAFMAKIGRTNCVLVCAVCAVCAAKHTAEGDEEVEFTPLNKKGGGTFISKN